MALSFVKLPKCCFNSAHFEIKRFQNYKKIIRRKLVSERSMRTDWACDWSKPGERFQAIFDVFCQRWNLYGMEGDKPLLIKLTANLTPYGTMIFIPAYWSFDWKRDLNWKAITTMHRARGATKQGQKLHANQVAKKRDSDRVRQLWLRAGKQGLKGEERTSWILKEMKWDSRTDERTLRRLLKDSSAGL